MEKTVITDNMLSVLESLMPPDPDDVARRMADDFRRRRIEKSLTREMLARQSGVALANITRFEQKGAVSLGNLIRLAIALGYVSELKSVFAAPKYTTMDELTRIRRNASKKRAHSPRKKKP